VAACWLRRTCEQPAVAQKVSRECVCGRPRGGVGGRSSLIAAIHVSGTPGWGVGGSSSISSPAAPKLPGVRGVEGGSGWMSLGTITRSRPSTRIAPALLAVPQ
jgi:hypothetical protein